MSQLSGFRRKPVTLTTDNLVRTGSISPGQSLPLVMEPTIENFRVEDWAKLNAAKVEDDLLKHGAILFRNFSLETASQFEQFARTFSPSLLDYNERSSPRSEVSRGIYTSTEHPADQFIHFHNEQSYTRQWPMKLWFFCLQPAESGGATPIADGRKVLELIPAEIRDRFREKKVMYVRNYNDGFGLTWQTAFQTTRRADVEDYCRRRSIAFEWKDGDRLRTRQVFPTIVAHPRTGQLVWFEHAVFFHVSSLEPGVREMMLNNFKEEDLPFNTYYGDGSPIESSALDAIRAAYKQAASVFEWRQGDLLLLDNMLTAHGRQPFTGARRVLVAMSDIFNSEAAAETDSTQGQ